MIFTDKLKPSPAQKQKCYTCTFSMFDSNGDLWACQFQTTSQKQRQFVENFFIKSCKGEKYENNGELFQTIPTNVLYYEPKTLQKVDRRKLHRIAAMTITNVSLIYLLIKILF